MSDSASSIRTQLALRPVAVAAVQCTHSAAKSREALGGDVTTVAGRYGGQHSKNYFIELPEEYDWPRARIGLIRDE